MFKKATTKPEMLRGERPFANLPRMRKRFPSIVGPKSSTKVNVSDGGVREDWQESDGFAASCLTDFAFHEGWAVADEETSRATAVF